MALYREGMVEALRVLRPGGTLWVKCKDENDGSHITIQKTALELGLEAKDLFVLATRPAPTRRHRRQKHALKTHSYLWVFFKPRKALRAGRTTGRVT
jgi:DNA modification methylase